MVDIGQRYGGSSHNDSKEFNMSSDDIVIELDIL